MRARSFFFSAALILVSIPLLVWSVAAQEPEPVTPASPPLAETQPAGALSTSPRVYLPIVMKSLPSAAWQVILSTNFEGSWSSPWRVYDSDGKRNGEYYWGKRNCRPYAGYYSGWAVGAGADGAKRPCGFNYPNNVRSSMDFGPFSLVGTSAAELRFKLWLNTQKDHDELFVCASKDNVKWDCGVSRSGNSNGWTEVVTNLASHFPLIGNLVGQPKVWISLYFYSDEIYTELEGVYVDNIVLRKCPAGASCP